jgi:tripartite-type tricarboxylate transporter receptor subunit TctC
MNAWSRTIAKLGRRRVVRRCHGGCTRKRGPTKPIRLVAPFPPGSSIDIIARLLAEPMGQALGTTVVVENKPGAGGNLGVDSVVKAPKDGYTIGIGAQRAARDQPVPRRRMSYDPVKDVAPIAVFGSSAIVLWVRARTGEDAAGFVAQAKAQPGKLNYAPTASARPITWAAKR